MADSPSSAPTGAAAEIRELAARIAGELDALAALAAAPLDASAREHLERVRQATALLSQQALALAANAPPTAAAGSDLLSGSPLPIVREEIIRELRGESPDLLEHLINLFSGSARETVTELARAVEARDGKAIAFRTHHLKGSASNFGAERLMFLCQAMEEKVRRGDLEGPKQLLAPLQREYDLVVTTLTAFLES